MAGTGIVCMPYAYQESGILIGIFLTFVAFLISYLTCWMVIKTAGNDIDYTDTLRRNFGQRGWNIGMACFIGNLYVPILIFFQLMAQNLCPVLLFIFYGGSVEMNLHHDWHDFNYTWTCVIIFVITFCMVSIKDISVFVRINSFGVIFISLIIFMIMGLGFYSLTDTTYTYSQ